jgi:hypothetical protein
MVCSKNLALSLLPFWPEWWIRGVVQTNPDDGPISYGKCFRESVKITKLKKNVLPTTLLLKSPLS